MKYSECITECNNHKKTLQGSIYQYNGVDFIISDIFPLPTNDEQKNLLIKLYIQQNKLTPQRFTNEDVKVGLLLKNGNKFEIIHY